MTKFFPLLVTAAITGCVSTQSSAPLAEVPATSFGTSVTITQRASQILNGSTVDWQQPLLADISRHLDQNRALGSDGAQSPASSLLADLSVRSPLTPSNQRGDVRGAAMVGPFASALSADRVLVVCREGEFDTLESSVVICLGELRARSVSNCVLFVSGRIEADQIDTATICVGGRLDVRTTRRLSLVAGAGERDR